MPTTIAVRLKEFRAHLNLEQTDLAKTGKVHVQTISRYERGVQSPKLRTVELWETSYGVRPGWLLSGDGPMLHEPKDIEGEVRRLLAPLGQQERRRVLSSLLNEAGECD